MNNSLIHNWNSRVGTDDTVFCLGDICLTSKVDEFKTIIDGLNGRIKLVVGNHDKIIQSYRKRFDIIDKSINVQINGQHIFCSHFCHKVWERSHYGSWHLHGHSHGSLNEYDSKEGKILDVGVDSYNSIFGGFYPFSINEISSIMVGRPDNFNYIQE
jgi:calcineurin-like phosphoesterase family protein